METSLISLEEQVSSLESLSGEEIHSFIVRLQAELALLPQVETKLDHHFSDGVYGRALTIPAGTLIIGKIHKFKVLNILLKGEVTVASIDGVKRFKAPFIYTSGIGAKRLIFAHEESIWMNVLPTEETDLETIEQKFIADEIDVIAHEES